MPNDHPPDIEAISVSTVKATLLVILQVELVGLGGICYGSSGLLRQEMSDDAQ